MIRIREEDINTREYWDNVYKTEREQGRRRTNNDIWMPFMKYIPNESIYLLDVGCGGGELLKFMHGLRPEIKLFGYDLSAEALITAKKTCPEAVLYSTKPTGKQFDIVICSETLEHINDNKSFMQYLVNNTRNDGLIITTTPYGWDYGEKEHIWDYQNADDLINLVSGQVQLIDNWVLTKDLCCVMKRVV